MTSADVIGIIGIGVSVVGFGLTVWQLVRTANAAKATEKAINDANAQMIVNHLLVLSPQIVTMEAELDAAIAVGDKVAAIKALVTYSHAATQVAALLEAQSGDADAVLIVDLRTSARSASASKAQLVSGVAKPLGIVLKSVVAEIGQTASACSALSTRYQVRVV